MFYFSLSRISLPVFPLLPQPFPHSFLSFFPTTLSLSEDLIISVIKLSPALLITFAEPCLSFDTFYMPSFYGKDHPHIFHHAITCMIVSYFLLLTSEHACTHTQQNIGLLSLSKVESLGLVTQLKYCTNLTMNSFSRTSNSRRLQSVMSIGNIIEHWVIPSPPKRLSHS